MIIKTVTFKFDGSESPIDHFRMVYEDFLTYETTTGRKDLWDEQKKVYEEILFAPDPGLALIKYRAGGLSALEIADQRLKERGKK